jgi:hypothetical protein
MSANALIVSVLVALVVVAAALRIAIGPIVTLKDGDTLYAQAKAGPVPGVAAAPVELAVSGARPAH